MRDAESFDEFYRTTSKRMVRYGYAVIGDLAEAQDVVQEAYTRAWQHWRTLILHQNPEGWVRLTVARLCVDRWRWLGRWRSMLMRTMPAEPNAPPSELTVMLTSALRRLPVAHRQALAMHYLLDMSIADLAEELGVPVGTVKSWLSRGRAGLSAVLSEPGDCAGKVDHRA